ncbi:hypothetical protein AgCh_009876 [Apium graveolens]
MQFKANRRISESTRRWRLSGEAFKDETGEAFERKGTQEIQQKMQAPKKEKAPPPSSKPAKSGGGKQKKKWSKGKQKEKVNNMVLFDKPTYDKLLSEAPKFKLITPSILSDRLRVYNHFDMKHETTSLLESRAQQSSQQWFYRYDKDQNEDLLESMRYYIEAAEVHSSIDAGNKTHAAYSRASLVSLQIRMLYFKWLNLSKTNARCALVEQSHFQEALIIAEVYGLNQPCEWALVLWNQMLNPELT